MTTTVRVNGETRTVAPGAPLAAVIAEIVPDAGAGIAVAVNGEIVPRAQWREREVNDGDTIEIVRAVQGG